MKYIKAYIKKICPNVEVAESETKSNSRYYTLNNCMTIRLSDHYAVTLKESDLNIVQVFNKDEFIVICKGCGVPMTKKRKEVNDFIKSLYEYKSVKHFVENNKREIIARKKKEEEKSDDDPLKDMYCNAVYKLYTKHRGVFDYGDYCSAFGVLCCDKHFSLIAEN